MAKYISYTIKTMENVKLAKTDSQIETEDSLGYIPGSAIRGLFIYKYIIKNNIENINEGVHREKLLKGGIKFLNAYLVKDDERSIPFPKCYFATKEEIRSFSDSMDIRTGFGKVLGKDDERVKRIEFAYLDDDDYYVAKTRKISNLHINKRGEKNKLFRYEAIEKGQEFKGIIKVEKEEYLDDVFSLLSDSTVFLGGSKGSGYGKCLICEMNNESFNPEYEQFGNKFNFNNELYFLALSDIIYRTDLGEYKTYFEPELIEEALSINNVSLISSSIDTKKITSFNNKWNCRTPQINGIKAGSIFKYEFDGDIDEDLLKDFIDKGIGERKAEGFGRFIIMDSLKDSCLYKEHERQFDDLDIKDIIDKFSNDDKEQTEIILNRIYDQRVDTFITETVLKMYSALKNPGRMERSQWGNYFSMFKSLYYEEPEVGKRKFEQYMEHLNIKRSKSYKDLMSLYYENGRFYDTLKNFMKESDDVNAFRRKNHAEEVKIGNISSSVDSLYVYRKNIMTIIELCRYHLRKECKK